MTKIVIMAIFYYCFIKILGNYLVFGIISNIIIFYYLFTYFVQYKSISIKLYTYDRSKLSSLLGNI